MCRHNKIHSQGNGADSRCLFKNVGLYRMCDILIIKKHIRKISFRKKFIRADQITAKYEWIHHLADHEVTHTYE